MTEIGVTRASDKDGGMGRRGADRRDGRARMMYRVVELGSNCSGKWPRLE